MAIDIGTDAIDRDNSSSLPDRTYVFKDNPANENGTLTSIEVWVDEDLANCIVGTFYITNGNTLKCRDSESIGSVASGSKQTFPVSIAVKIGDYIGIYATSGSIERDNTGGEGAWYVNGQYIDPDDETIYTHLNYYIFSLYGTGTEAGGVTHELAGISNGVASVAGIIKVSKKIAGISEGISQVTGLAKVIRGLAGISLGFASLAGAIKRTRAMAGLSAGLTSVSGGITLVGAFKALAGVIAGRASLVGSLSVVVVKIKGWWSK